MFDNQITVENVVIIVKLDSGKFHQVFFENKNKGMINISRLQKGDIIVSLVNNSGMNISIGDHLRVIEKGHSRWDNLPYVDAKTKDGYKVEIMKDFMNYDLLIPLT